MTQIDVEPMFDQLEIFSRLSHSKVFPKPDLAKGFFQIPLHPESSDITVFGTHEGLFCYEDLSFGLTNFSAVLKRKIRP